MIICNISTGGYERENITVAHLYYNMLVLSSERERDRQYINYHITTQTYLCMCIYCLNAYILVCTMHLWLVTCLYLFIQVARRECVRVWVCMCVCVFTQTFIQRLFAHTHTHAPVVTQAVIYTHIYTQLRTIYVCALARVRACVYIYIYIYTYIYKG